MSGRKSRALWMKWSMDNMDEEKLNLSREKFEPVISQPIEVDASDTVLGICLLRLYEVT